MRTLKLRDQLSKFIHRFLFSFLLIAGHFYGTKQSCFLSRHFECCTSITKRVKRTTFCLSVKCRRTIKWVTCNRVWKEVLRTSLFYSHHATLHTQSLLCIGKKDAKESFFIMWCGMRRQNRTNDFTRWCKKSARLWLFKIAIYKTVVQS